MEQKSHKIIEAAKAGGEVLRRYFGQKLDITEKSMPADFFTKADIESEKAILASLKINFPDYNIHAEESGELKKGSDYTFFIDPLDGSNNFVTGIANFSVSIALMKANKMEAAIIYQPILNQAFYAQNGKGAFLNGQKISVSNITEIGNASLSYVVSYGHSAEEYGQTMKNLELLEVKRVFYNWSVAMDFCLLASGKIDGIINDGCEIYDYLAGKLIAKEAGAMIFDFHGQPELDEKSNHFIVVNNKDILDKLLTVIKL